MTINNQRMLDLLRVCRSELFVEHELIDEAEYAWLAGLPSVATHARLKDYDELRTKTKELEHLLARALVRLQGGHEPGITNDIVEVIERARRAKGEKP